MQKRQNRQAHEIQITERGLKRKKVIPACVFIYTCIVIILFEIPRTVAEKPSFVILNKIEGNPAATERTLLKSGMNIGFIDARNKIQTVNSNSAAEDMTVSLRSIMLICKSDHHFLDQVALKIQKSLSRLPYVNIVTYCSDTYWPEPGGVLPDVFIVLDMPVLNEDSFLLSREMNVKIDCEASSSISEVLSDSIDNASSGPVVPFKIQSELQHSSRTFCIECPGTEYEKEAKNIAHELTAALKKQFENLLNKYGELPVLPEMLYGTYIKPPDFSFLEDNVEFMISGRKLLKDNDTIWQFKELRDTKEAFKIYNEELENLGWTKIGESGSYLHMKKGDEVLYISRTYMRNIQKDNIVANSNNSLINPMIAHYSRSIASGQTEQAMDMLLEKGEEIKILLLFKNYFMDTQSKERLCSIIKQSHTPTLEGYLLLGNYHADRGEMEKGRESLMFARAMQLVEKNPYAKAQEIENLAEKLGDENLINIPLNGDILRRTGFICMEDVNSPMQIERGLDEPVLFFTKQKNEQIRAISLSVIRAGDTSLSKSYRLLKVEKQGKNSSSSESDGIIEPGGRWAAESRLQDFIDADRPLQVTIESIVRDRFLFNITSGQADGTVAQMCN
ncbi:MAG: hypothetical protein JW787_14230 [Sedimentisphaerales bacterium]|nr:hypothetical protein [Sedimentisphaerales bacterium]